MTGSAKKRVVRGWCPSLLTPMAAGDGLLVRVKPRAATLTAEQAETVAAAAGRYGNGIVDLTNRGHLQVRGLLEAGVDGFAGQMAQAGLAAAHPRAEAIRNVLTDPLGPDDPAAAFDSHRLAHRLSATLESDPAFHELPDKFGLLVDAGVTVPLTGCSADIMVRPDGDSAVVALAGGDCRLSLPVSEVEDSVCRLLAAFLSWMKGQAGSDGSRPAESPSWRMKTMVAARSAREVYDAAALEGELRPAIRPHREAGRPPVGFLPVANAAQGCFAIGAPFGNLEAEMLADLADLARRLADGTIRVTPWKSVILPGVTASDAAGLRKTALEMGLVAEPGDPRSRIVTCAGRPRCHSAEADTRADAAFFAAAVLAGTGLLHISGCAKGCAHPAPAATTLVATPDGYDLVFDGLAGDPPERTNLAREAAAAILAQAEAPIPDAIGPASN